MDSHRVFLSRALVLGGAAASLETLLVLTTGVMPPDDIALNFALWLAVFLGAATIWIFVGRSSRLDRISGEAVLLLVSICMFAGRGCLGECGGDGLWRGGVPLGVFVASIGSLALLRRARPTLPPIAFVPVAVAAMTLAALDFARRDGVQLEREVLAKVLPLIAIAAGLGAIVVRRGWLTKVLWTVVLATASVSWARFEAPPPRLEPTANSMNRSREPGLQTRPNLVLMVMDTVRADHLSLYGYARKTSPNLDSIARESLVFSRAIASGNYSLPSHASLFTGLLPSEHGAHQRIDWASTQAGWVKADDYAISEKVQTIADRLRTSGYATGGVSGNFVYLSRWTGLQKGFAAFDDRPLRRVRYHPLVFPFQRRFLGVLDKQYASWNAASVTKGGLSFATGPNSPFFLFLNYFDAHAPYSPRKEHLFLNDGMGSDVPPIPAYDSEIGSVDAAVGEVLANLRQAGLLDKTIVVITSDHGEFFGERGLQTHAMGGYEQVLHVPLIIRYPDRLRPGLVSAPFGLHEVPRLIFDLLEGRSVEWAYAEGDEPKVLAQVWGRVAVADRPGPLVIEPNANVVYGGSYKLIDRSKGDDELYDLAADPGEERNLLSQPDTATLALETRMRVAVANLPRARIGADPNATDADIAALRGLGYISLRKPGTK